MFFLFAFNALVYFPYIILIFIFEIFRNGLKINNLIIFSTFLIFLVYLGGILNSNSKIDNIEYVSIIVLVSNLIFSSFALKYPEALPGALKYFIFGIILNAFPSIISSYQSGNKIMYGNLYTLWGGMPIYTSHLSAYLSIGFAILLIQFNFRNTFKIGYLILILILILMGLFVGSRSFFILTFFIIVYQKLFLKNTLPSATVIIFLFLIFLFLLPENISFIINRFSEFSSSNSQDHASRLSLWISSLDAIPNYPIGGFDAILGTDFPATHNIILDSFRISGWISGITSILYILFTIGILVKYFKRVSSRVIILISILLLYFLMIESIYGGLYKILILYNACIVFLIRINKIYIINYDITYNK